MTRSTSTPPAKTPTPVTPGVDGYPFIEQIDPILRRDIVLLATGLSRSALYRLVQSGEFPTPLRITEGTVGWRQSDVADWIRARPEAEGV